MAKQIQSRRRLLLFNWTQFDDDKFQADGVTVYLKNLVDILSRHHDIDLYFLSSGVRADRSVNRCYVEETANTFSSRGVRTFEIVNSPVAAPALRMFDKINVSQSDMITRNLFREFLQQHGPFRAIHFHNIEGISTRVLTLRPQFPDTRFCFTWHNYVPVCPQVNLLHQDQEDCRDYQNGFNCTSCFRGRGFLGELAKLIRRRSTADYRRWREENIALLDKMIDVNLVVSDLVKETIVPLGIRPESIVVLPLGMDAHQPPDAMKAAWRAKPRHRLFTFSFLGGNWPAKGLPFLAEAVDRHASRFLRENAKLLVVSKLPKGQRKQLNRPLQNAFREVEFIDGYQRDEIPDLAQQIDVNIVPSIWRETFNQVGYEMLCTGTPSILSSTVGLKMYYKGKDDFIFESGNHERLVERMVDIAQHPCKLEKFWDDPVQLLKLEDHASDLVKCLFGEPANR